MARGRPWIGEENELIERMVREGVAIADIKERLPNRTFRAVENQIHRLGLRLGHSGGDSKKIFFPEISADKMIEREHALKILAGAIERHTVPYSSVSDASREAELGRLNLLCKHGSFFR